MHFLKSDAFHPPLQIVAGWYTTFSAGKKVDSKQRKNASGAECDEYIRIFEYSNILGTNIYSDIHSGQFCLYEYIRTFVRVKFVCTNIFRHSFMSVLESENRPNIRIYSNIRTIFNTNIYSDIRSCQIFYTNIFGHSFV